MPCRLILNADDFGLTRSINRAIAELHQAEVLTSATLMATGPAFDDAIAVARSLPTLGVGCHVVLVDGTPVSSPEEIPTLLGPDRKTFRLSLAAFARDLYLGRIDEGEIAREALAQVKKLQYAGVDVTHLDTHKHTHCFPQVAQQLIDLVNKTSIACIRNPFEPAFARSLNHASLQRRLQLALLHRYQPAFSFLSRSARTTDGTLGISTTGRLNDTTLNELFKSLPSEGVFEICCHPGYNDRDLADITTRLRPQREVERKALLTQIPQVLSLPNPPQLIHYGNLKQ